jgi:serine/threonine protein kinase
MNPIHRGRVIAGKYRLEACRARGGMGSVWVARHVLLGTPLALKFIEPRFASSPEARGRFEREAKTVALLQGTHVAHIHDYGVEDGTPYIAMELLQGEDLNARLTREGRLPVAAAVHIVHQVAKVLRRAHETGIIHRDLKPGNIFLVASDDDEVIVKVLDFGVAKATKALGPHSDPTKSGTLVGSPRYMSPEQARGVKELDHRSDLWSLGVIAFRMLTGELPFPGTEIGDVILKICTEPAPVPSRLVFGLSPEIDRFFVRALERDPDKRFQSAREMAQAFAAAAGQAPPSSPAAIDLLARRTAGGAGEPATSSDPSNDAQAEQAAVIHSFQSANTTVDALIPASMAEVERTLPSYLREEEPVSCPPDAPPPFTLPFVELDPPHEMGVALSNAPGPSLDRPHLFMATAAGEALRARVGWGVTGAAAASLVLGGFLLVFQPARSGSSPAALWEADGAGNVDQAQGSTGDGAASVTACAAASAANIDAPSCPAVARALPPPAATGSAAPAGSAGSPANARPAAEQSSPRRRGRGKAVLGI